MLRASIQAIEYYLPEHILDNNAISAEYPDWSPEKISSKTGIFERHVVAAGECSSDLAFAAAQRLFASNACAPGDIDYLLLCTQSPDHFLPTTACLLQHRLGLPVQSGALDFNLGCSGWVYGLGLAQGLIETGQARRVLLLTAETYTKFIHPADRSVRTIFGDAAAATLVQGVESESGAAFFGPYVYGTDGSGGPNLAVPAGGMRMPRSEHTAVVTQDEQGNSRSLDNLFMDGAEIFNFTLKAVPQAVQDLLTRSGLSVDQVDLFIFHQANQYMLEHLRKKMKLPAEKFYLHLSHCGNTVSSTIPIALHHAVKDGAVRAGATVMVVGFGVGYSWGASLVRWV